MKGKRGQYFILAAVIIVIILLGMYAITSYTEMRPSQARIYDLSGNFLLEAQNVIDYGIYNDEDVNELLENFSYKFHEYAGNDTEFIVIYGNRSNLTIISFFQEEVNVSEETAGGFFGGNPPPNIEETIPAYNKITFAPRYSDVIIIKLPRKKPDGTVEIVMHRFPLREHQNFFYIFRAKHSDIEEIVKGEAGG